MAVNRRCLSIDRYWLETNIQVRRAIHRLRPRSSHAAQLRKGKEQLTAAHEDLVRAVLIAQLGGVTLARLELDGDLLLVEQVGALENNAKTTLADLLADAVVDAHHIGRRSAAAHLEG